MSWCVSLPPPPCASSTRVSGREAGRRAGRVRIVFHGRAAVAVVGGAGAFARNHGRAQRVLRRAARAEGRALVRLLQALQDQAADALGGFLGTWPDATPNARSRVERRVGLAQAAGRSRGSRRCRATCAGRPRRPRRCARCAGRLPSRRTARLYWFSTSARPLSSCSTPCGCPAGYPAARSRSTTIGTWYRRAMGSYSS